MTRSHPEANLPCDCSALYRLVDELEIPVIFDARTNEYQLIWGENNNGHMPIYH